MNTIRIANAAGFWGDSLDAPRRTAESAELDYLTLEYLAELTMSILARQKQKDPAAGYVTDFPLVVESLLPALRNQPGMRIVTNAGGMNPVSCANAVAKALSAGGMDDLAIGVVTGDDLLPKREELLGAGERFEHFDTRNPLGELNERIVNANAYLGAAGIVEALAGGARIVITGRVADASLTVGPAVHEFGWAWDDWGRLAAATVAGHLIECGAQATGGMYSDWSKDISLGDVGYPIAEVSEDGDVTITKPAGSGGAVTVSTLAQQLIYEIGDPEHYLTPDVDANFAHIELEETGEDRVAVRGAVGLPAPPRLKVSMAYRDGYTVSGTIVVAGRDAVAKAEQCAKIIFDRVRIAGFSLSRTHHEILGAGDTVPGVWSMVLSDEHSPPEVVLRIAAHDPSPDGLERLAREIAPLVTSGPPGVTGYIGGRAKPRPVYSYWPTTVARTAVRPEVEVRPSREWTS